MNIFHVIIVHIDLCDFNLNYKWALRSMAIETLMFYEPYNFEW